MRSVQNWKETGFSHKDKRLRTPLEKRLLPKPRESKQEICHKLAPDVEFSGRIAGFTILAQNGKEKSCLRKNRGYWVRCYGNLE
jgi:hypothetical protein